MKVFGSRPRTVFRDSLMNVLATEAGCRCRRLGSPLRMRQPPTFLSGNSFWALVPAGDIIRDQGAQLHAKRHPLETSLGTARSVEQT